MRENIPSHIILYIVLMIICFCMGNISQARIVPVNISEFYVTPNHPSTLTWRISKKHITKSGLSYKILDYWGNPVPGKSGKVHLNNSGKLALDITLPSGFYELVFPSQHQMFGVLSLPEFTGQVDPFFSISGHISQHVKPWQFKNIQGAQAMRSALIHILRRSGITSAGDSISWPNLNPTFDQWNWNGRRKYDAMHKIFKENGVSMMQHFSTVPDYLGNFGRPRWGLPRNMLGVARAWSIMADRWHSSLDSIDIWNEPTNYSRTDFPADQLYSMVKAIGYATRVKYPQLKIGCAIPFDDRGLGLAQANGILDVINFMEFHAYHTYNTPEDMYRKVESLRKGLAKYHHPNLPLWITESGQPWHSRNAKSKIAQPQLHSGQQSALSMIMKGIAARACGVARYLPFVYIAPHRKHQSSFAMVRTDGTPLRLFAAYAQAVLALSKSDYIGNLHCDSPDIKKAYVFAKGNKAVVVLYTGQVKEKSTIKLQMKYETVRGMDGRVLHSDQPGYVPVPDGLCYVYTTRQAAQERLKQDVPAMHLYRIGQHPGRVDKISPIVLQYMPDHQAVTVYQNGYWLHWVDNGNGPAPFSMQVRVINLGRQTHHVKLWLKQRGAKADGIETSVPAMSMRQVKIPVKVNLGRNMLQVEGKIINETSVPQVQPLGVLLYVPRTLQTLLKQYPSHLKLPIGPINRWQPRHRKGIKSSIAWKQDVWRLTIQPHDGGSIYWSAPELTIDKTNVPKLDRAIGVIIRGRCNAQYAALWAARLPEVDNIQYKALSLFPHDGNWHCVFVPFNKMLSLKRTIPRALNLRQAEKLKLRIGMSTRWQTVKAVFEMSDMYLVFSPKTGQ